MMKRDQESDCHCTVFAFSSAFCREDFLFIVMVSEEETSIACARVCTIKSVPN